MKAYWMKFTDGTEGYCEGETPYDAVVIAEHLTGKTVDTGGNKYEPLKSGNVASIPYPTDNMIWQFDHPKLGKTPGFCRGLFECRNRGGCPRNIACTE